jgi:asparagine synthase (glutamine-hydrolysing)
VSGICGIVNLDGAPVEGAVLSAMAAAMAFRGPDRLAQRLLPGAGLAHALLHCDVDTPETPQPASLDGHAWIVADARIDARGELLHALAATGREVAASSDATLILHAWHAWGEACVERLLGDFAFAIWDARERRLFCARDPLGVKSLFVARAGRSLLFANTVASLCAHPRLPRDFDEHAIADFLLFEYGRDPSTTGLRAVRRLEAAHALSATARAERIAPYWRLEEMPRVAYRDEGDYVAHFEEVLEQAVGDRMRGPRVAVQMSGGLDSTSIAALAKESLARRGGPHDIQAHTVLHEGLVPSDERRFAALAAGGLAIPASYYLAREHRLYDAEAYETAFPEPFHAPEACAPFHASLRGAARQAPVLLTGFDGDLLLNEGPRPYLRLLWRERRWRLLAVEGMRRALRGRLPRRRSPRHDEAQASVYPDWIDAGLEARLGLRERWERSRVAGVTAGAAGIRPRAVESLVHVQSSSFYWERYDPGVTGLALDCRHPLLDLRVVRVALSLPPSPWCVDKRILREAMRARLPAAVLSRPKTPLPGRPEQAMLARDREELLRHFAPGEMLGAFVDARRLARGLLESNPDATWVNLRAVTLDRWLRRWQPAQRTQRSALNEIA